MALAGQDGGMQKCALPLHTAPARPHTAGCLTLTSYGAAAMGPAYAPVLHSVTAAATAGAVAGAGMPPPAVPHRTWVHGHPVTAPHHGAQSPPAPKEHLVTLHPDSSAAPAPSQRLPPVAPASPQQPLGPQPMDITPHHTPKPQHQHHAQCLPQRGAAAGRGGAAQAVTSTAVGLVPPVGAAAAPQAALLRASWDAGACRGNMEDEQQEEEEEEEEEARLWDEGGPRGTYGGAYDSDEDWMMSQQQQQGMAAYGRGSRAGSVREYGSLWEDAEEEQLEREQGQGQERDCVLDGGGGAVGYAEEEQCREEGQQLEVDMAEGEQQAGPQEGWGEAGLPALAVAAVGMKAAAPAAAEAAEVPCAQTHVAGLGETPPRSRSRGRARGRSRRAVDVSTLFGWDAQLEEQQIPQGLQQQQQQQVHPCGGACPVRGAPPPPPPPHTAPGVPADTSYTSRMDQEQQQQAVAAAAAAGLGTTAAAAPAPSMPAPPPDASMLGPVPGCAATSGTAPATAPCSADDANPLASEECSPDFWDDVPAVYEVYDARGRLGPAQSPRIRGGAAACVSCGACCTVDAAHPNCWSIVWHCGIGPARPHANGTRTLLHHAPLANCAAHAPPPLGRQSLKGSPRPARSHPSGWCISSTTTPTQQSPSPPSPACHTTLGATYSPRNATRHAICTPHSLTHTL